MANNETFKAVIEVNASQARKELKGLEEMRDRQMAQQKALYASRKKEDHVLAAQMQKDIDTTNKKIGEMKKYITGLDSSVEKLSGQSYKNLINIQKQLEKRLKSGAVKRNSQEWKDLTQKIRECKEELNRYKEATALQVPAWKRFFNFLNANWGAMTQIIGAVTGLSMTMRKTVKDFAEMEEEMADVRKYTGMTMEGVRELNEEFRKMDTRTSREQLNQLAGAAGRLGITSKEAVMEFVDAADKISVALGDDLGDEAVDQIGKLAMAFGEDDRLGLRGAMLATGSAINELAQNSAAKAGYLVEFTARVAGVGKQLGLTQAQIMGFGTVMDEALLKDEMASTAFSQMITKMATDSAKFAKFAGMEASKFADLVKNDINDAILALADNMKKQDASNMLKMFGDMGLDGTRAVGVLTNLADKIDDVRRHQETATEAYRDGKSVINEYAVMNETVQAKLDKCKKKFKEMSIELGERLLPIMRYAITGTSMLIKGLSSLTGFISENWKAVVVLTTNVLLLTAAWKAQTIWQTVVDTKNKALTASTTVLTAAQTLLRSAAVALQATWALLTKGVAGYTVVMRAARMASLTNPWTALATVLSIVGVAIYGVVKAWNSHKKALAENVQEMKELRAQQKLEADMSKQVGDSIAEEKTRIERLSRIIHSNAYSLNERRNAIRKIQEIIPDYHASISSEGKLYNENSSAIRQYIQDLNDAAMAEAVYQKKVEVNKKKMDLSFRQNRIENSLKAVEAYRQTQQQVTTEMVYENGSVTRKERKTKSAEESDRQEKRHRQRLEEVKSETKVVEAEEKYLDQVLDKNKKVNELFNKKVASAKPVAEAAGKVTGDYKTEAEMKKEEEERKKREAAEKKRLQDLAREAKASYDEQIAMEMLAYRQGISTYTDYIEEKHNITQNYYDQLKKIYGEDSVEYRKLLDNRERDESDYYSWQQKMKEKDMYLQKMQEEAAIRRQFYDENDEEAYMNEEVLQENLFQLDIKYMKLRQNLYKEGSREWMEQRDKIEQEDRERQFQLEQQWNERLMKYRQDAGTMNYQKLLEIELKGVETLYGALVRAGRMTQEEYDRIIQHIRMKYAEMEASQTADNDIQEKASKALQTARRKSGAKDYGAGSDIGTGTNAIFSAVEQQKIVNEQLKELYGEDYENNAEYQEAKRQLDTETMQSIVAGAQAAYETISQMMSAASSYAKACSDLEVAQITANYDKQIEAAGKNTKKREKLEKKRDEEIRKAKTKANKKAMAMELAQAIAQSAMGAISAYSSTMAGAPYPANLVLAPVSAGIALAAGALQIATIKKQHQAEEAGYYEGGFTGGRNYRKKAGVVHEGEFVANHNAVNNPNLEPVFTLLDNAQRNNRVASLTRDDIRGALGERSQVVAPVVNVNTDNPELQVTMEQARDVIGRLSVILEAGIHASVSIDGEDGVKKNLDKYNALMKNK